ncbi:hypothetical protein Ocin01_01844 [Orchesella cincta]|uniref:Uncharacterized protein n=1 Tax=Orchesella cincta TaxID=48709 RepID=A0A1D2NI13_ORCCI|nr:hypothetical protein Ocin01_01844 [Orchesella cincta]
MSKLIALVLLIVAMIAVATANPAPQLLYGGYSGIGIGGASAQYNYPTVGVGAIYG